MRVVVVGAGIIGLTFAYNWLERFPSDEVVIIEKEGRECFHASGRNSGILHAGFYYNADSLKGKLTATGNRQMKEFCRHHSIPVLETGKLVVAKGEEEIETLKELERRSQLNGAGAYLISQKEAEEIEPNVKTYQYALWSPNTASVDPRQVCRKLREILEQKGVRFQFNTRFEEWGESYDLLVNAAGLYADKIAHQFGVGERYTMLPFKGLYLKYLGKNSIRTQIYPVPNIKNPFLGIHFTLLADGTIKIGPTAIPAFWREHYTFGSRFNWRELVEILKLEGELFFKNSFGFRDLALYEMQFYWPGRMVAEAKKLVKELEGEFTPYPPGIRAQLVDLEEKRLVMDFLVEYKPGQIHILNAVSPAFTASFTFTDYVIQNYLNREKGEEVTDSH
jgi:L-2-hydroxyglutarate oxidase LhgO